MGDAGRRPDSKAQGQGAPPLPLPEQRQGAEMHKVIFLIYTRQTQHHATQSAAGSGWGAGYGLLLQLLLGAVCAGQQESPGSAQVSAAHTKLPRGICLLKGTTILRMHLLGHTFPLEPDPLSCISNGVQVSKIPWKGTSIFFAGGLLWCLVRLRFLPRMPSLPALVQTCTFHGTCCPTWPRAASPQTSFPF